jgi:hypothetical protein
MLNWKAALNLNIDNELYNQVRFVHVRKSPIQGLFKDIQGHVSANSKTKYWRR